MTMNDLIKKLGTDGGAIVSTGDCSELEIAHARARGYLYVDDNGLGYVLRSRRWLERAQSFGEVWRKLLDARARLATIRETHPDIALDHDIGSIDAVIHAIEDADTDSLISTSPYDSGLDDDDAECMPTSPRTAPPPLQALVRNFADVMLEKLAAKDGEFADRWTVADDVPAIQTALHEHMEKGDPVDVANYAAFLWYHGATTIPGVTLRRGDAP